LTAEQQAILERRGVLTPDEIHKLAHKGKKAACHSDNVADADAARQVQERILASEASG
jgi:phosphomethylpyrimidine synthase